MKYDDASWHYGGDFPSDLPPEAGGTHIGMFVCWCLLNNLAGEIHVEEFPEELEKLKQRASTPGKWFLDACDEKFTDEDLNEQGNAFAKDYYDNENGEYSGDYETCLGSGHETLYHVPDTWQTYDTLAPIIQKRYTNWRTPKKWWQIWK